MPPPRWTKAGMVQCRQCDIAWRVLDAQFFGVPQRRRRIFLVADFGTGTRCAEKILFEPESLPGDTAPGNDEKEKAAAGIAARIGYTGAMGFDVNASITNTGRPLEEQTPTVKCGTRVGIAGFKGGQSAKAESIGYRINQCPTVTTQQGSQCPAVAVYDLTHADEVVRPVTGDKTQSLNARMGTGGNQTPVIQTFCIAGNVVDRKAKQNGTGISKDVSSTLNTVDKHAVCYSIDRAAFNQGKNAKYDFRIDGTGKNETLTARGPNAVCIGNGQINQLGLQDKAGALNCMHDQQIVAVDVQHIRCAGFVRRLTPLECERLQGLPDNWTLIPGVACPDSKRYKAIGNGMAQPCADFILRRLMRNAEQGE